MTLILELEHKLIFYKPGILRYAMRHARMQLCVAQDRAERHRLLSLSLRRGWAEAKAQLAALQRLQALAPEGRDERFQQAPPDAPQVASRHDARRTHMRMDVETVALPGRASTALASRQLH